jgi:ubiquinone/menaquinone biosynthesis C-methylase UbiE
MKTTISTTKGKTCPPPYIPSSEKLNVNELQEAYDKIAIQYDKKTWFDQHVLGVARRRKQLMSRAHGKILDVACGTGLNFPHFPQTSEITAIDLSQGMLAMASQKATQLNLKVHTRLMDAQRLDFADGSFDTVTSALSTCTFPDPILALQEMRRVCRPRGLILLLEHGHSSLPWLANYQDRHVLQHYQQHAGCRWNQDPLDLIREAGLKICTRNRAILGMFYSIEATPLG